MTSRERFLKVINGEMPDRVPVTLFIADQGHFITQVYPGVDPFDFLTLQLKVIEIQKQLGADVFLRWLYDRNYPIHIMYGGLDVEQQTENWEVTTEEVENGNTLIKRSTIKTPKGNLIQEFSINELRKGTYMYSCTKKPIHSPEDLEIAMEYEPKMPAGFKTNVKKTFDTLKKALGEDGILGSWTPHGPFNNCSLLIDHEELYTLFLTEPEYYDKLMNFAMERALDYTAAIDEAGPDVHCVGGNVPGGFLGKQVYDKYILPYEKKYIEFVQKNGSPAMYHNCGEIMNLVESYKDLGVRIVEPFSPAPLGDADLAKARQIVNGDYIMLAGVDQVNVLQKGTREQVREVTEKTIKIGKPGGKFILQSADFLEYGTPLENLEAYVKTAIDNAWY